MKLPEIRVTERDRFALATVHGACDIDVTNAAELGAVLLELVPPETRGMVLDLNSVSYIDSAGLRMLFGLVRRLSLSRQTFGLVLSDTSPLRRILAVTHLDDVAVVGASSEACLSALEAGAGEL